MTPTTHTSPGHRRALRSVLATATVIAVAAVSGAQVVHADDEVGTTPWIIPKAAVAMEVPADLPIHNLSTKQGKRSLNELALMDPDIREIVTAAGRKNVLGLASGSQTTTSMDDGTMTIDVGWQGIIVWKLGSSRGLTSEEFVAEYRDDFEQAAGVPVEIVEVGGEPALKAAGVNDVAPGSIDAHTNYVFVTPKGVMEVSFNTQAADASGHDAWLQPIVDSLKVLG